MTVPRIELVDPTAATGTTREIFERVERHAGRVPNGLRVVASSPAALQAWWSFERALDRGALTAATREQVALAVATINRCEYCQVVHAAAALAAGPGDARTDAAVTFATAALVSVGAVTDEDLDRARAAGLGDAELVEVLAVVAINVFHNLCHRLAATPLDPTVAVDR